MIKGRQYMRVRKYPKLAELYKFLYNDEIQNAHNAVFDTKYCFLCYIKLFPSDPNIFYFGDKAIQLTAQQSDMVFEDVQTSMLIVAGAGSGKTTSMISRIKHLVDSGIPENSIVLTTFTRNAAQDIRDKLYEIMGYIPEIQVGTFDSIAKFHVMANDLDSDDITEVHEYAPRFLKLITDNPKIIQKVKYLFVDEVQDINQVQHRIMNAFHKNGSFIVGIGDDSQNIYEFRGSNIEYILRFSKTFAPCKTHMLTTNFRSTDTIVTFANKIIEKNKNKIPKTMIADPNRSDGGDPIVIHGFKNGEVQYRYVLDKIKDVIETRPSESICVMCWINKPLVEFQNILTENAISNVYIRDVENSRDTANCVILNTIHKSKGLEWDHVFLISMTDENNKNIFKYAKKNNLNNDAIDKQIEANRRLFYVAITRAKKTLHILSSDFEMTRFIVATT
jgi:superfamily I DNA/RNA helicase